MKFHGFVVATVLGLISVLTLSAPLQAASTEELQRDSQKVLKKLYANNPKAAEMGKKAIGVLVFPKVVKAGFIFGGQGGQGVLYQNGLPSGYYTTAAGSYGLQAGVQTFGYVLFFMNINALTYLQNSDGWEVGVGPSIVVVDEGFAKSMSSTTLQKDIYAFIFNQKGLMAGLGIQGSKITQYYPSENSKYNSKTNSNSFFNTDSNTPDYTGM
jgi:lipid-binding SYLF domain-containing protein